MRAEGKPIPHGQSFRAIVDTGAVTTCIDLRILEAIGAVQSDFVEIHTASTKGQGERCPIFDASFIIQGSPAQLVFPLLQVVGIDLTGSGADALLGMNALQHMMLVANGPAGTFSLAG